jgi:hypothetical protein
MGVGLVVLQELAMVKMLKMLLTMLRAAPSQMLVVV